MPVPGPIMIIGASACSGGPKLRFGEMNSRTSSPDARSASHPELTPRRRWPSVLVNPTVETVISTRPGSLSGDDEIE